METMKPIYPKFPSKLFIKVSQKDITLRCNRRDVTLWYVETFERGERSRTITDRAVRKIIKVNLGPGWVENVVNDHYRGNAVWVYGKRLGSVTLVKTMTNSGQRKLKRFPVTQDRRGGLEKKVPDGREKRLDWRLRGQLVALLWPRAEGIEHLSLFGKGKRN